MAVPQMPPFGDQPLPAKPVGLPTPGRGSRLATYLGQGCEPGGGLWVPHV